MRKENTTRRLNSRLLQRRSNNNNNTNNTHNDGAHVSVINLQIFPHPPRSPGHLWRTVLRATGWAWPVVARRPRVAPQRRRKTRGAWDFFPWTTNDRKRYRKTFGHLCKKSPNSYHSSKNYLTNKWNLQCFLKKHDVFCFFAIYHLS